MNLLPRSSLSSTLVQFQIPLTKRGVKKGDKLGPELCTVTVQMGLELIDWGACGPRIGGKVLSSLEYADDVTQLAPSRSMLEKMLPLLLNGSTKVGVILDPEKSTLSTNSETFRNSICMGVCLARHFAASLPLGRMGFNCLPYNAISA
ncbi:hypothetical protein V3C99_018160 [Haemonchus contortus]|uniref:Reverse transcriptase domain-containing protein n=1 Tax=Haemonchus contortus TaxID=6289 RepID=A0A7I4Z3Q8_HAECO